MTPEVQRFRRSKRSLVLAIIVTGPATAWGVSSCGDDADKNQPLTGCASAASLGIIPALYPVPSSSSAIISGSVTNAPCGVRGVSVLGAFSATPANSLYGSWSATVPLSALEGQKTCPAGLMGAATGVTVTAQAELVGDPGYVDTFLDASECVSLVAPFDQGVCAVGSPTMTVGCIAPTGSTLPPWSCEVPLGAYAPVRLDVFTSAPLMGRAVTWKSAGLTTVEPASPVVTGAGTLPSGVACCDPTGNDCVGNSDALVFGGSTAGVDTITATIDGRPSPAGTWMFAVQGPAQLAAVPASLVVGDIVTLTIRNPLGFQQTCTVTIPESVSLSAVLPAGGTPLQCDAGPASGAGTDCTVSVPAFSDLVREYKLESDVLEAGADAASPTGQVVFTCVDGFGQVGSSIIPIGAPADAGVKDSGGGG